MKYETVADIIAERDALKARLEQMRHWLKGGATIRATDPTGPVLEEVDGHLHGGLTVIFPPIVADSAEPRETAGQ